MSSSVLSLAQWLGGPDNIPYESVFPSTKKTYVYSFARSVIGWAFQLEAQPIIVDNIAYDRNGNPNFANSQVIGYFPKTMVSTSTYISVANAGSGIVNVTHPANLYTDMILPDARKNVPLLVFSFEWTQPSETIGGVTVGEQSNSHRIAKILAWEPGVTPGDPTTTTASGFVSLI
jgi:hypothetical protein